MATEIQNQLSRQWGRLRQWSQRWLLLTLVIWLLSLSGFWSGTSLLLLDRMQQLKASLLPGEFTLLLLEGGEESFTAPESQWLALLQRLREANAAQILLLELPSQVGATWVEAAATGGDLLLGRHLRFSEEFPDRLEYEPLMQSAQGLLSGVVLPGPAPYGIHRTQGVQRQLGSGELVWLLEAAAARQLGRTLPEEQEGDAGYLIDFSSAPDDLPRLRLEEVMAGNLLSEMVAGKSIIIARQQQRVETTVIAPLPGGNGPLTQAEFHAYALNTLLQDSATNLSSPLLVLLVTALAALLALTGYHRLPDQWSPFVAVGGALVYAALALLVLLVSNLYLPLTEAIVAHLLALTVLLRSRRFQMRENIIRILRQLSGRLQSRHETENFFDSDAYWDQIVTLVSQQLNMDRVMFLERVVGDHRLKEVKSLNCSFDDILEPRRDYERTPYSSAIEKGGPYRPDRQFLRLELGEHPTDIEFLTPLLFGGEVMGFWVYTLDPQQEQNLAQLEQTISRFSQQIAEILYLRRDRGQRRAQQSRGVNAWLSKEGGDALLVEDVQRSVQLLDTRLLGMEEVFDGQDTGTILYNLFGNVLHVNRRMSELAETLNITPYSITAVDFIRAMTGLELREARDILRRVTFEQENFFLPLHFAEQGDLSFVFQVRPLVGREEKSDFGETTAEALLPVKGLLIELADVSQIRRNNQLKELLLVNIFSQLRNDLESVVLATDLLTVTQLPPEQQSEVVTLLRNKVEQTVNSITRAEERIGGEGDTGTALYPVSPYDALKQAILNLEEEQERCRVMVELRLPRLMPLVMAVPNQFVSLFEGVLQALIAVPRNRVQCWFRVKSGRVVSTFASPIAVLASLQSGSGAIWRGISSRSLLSFARCANRCFESRGGVEAVRRPAPPVGGLRCCSSWISFTVNSSRVKDLELNGNHNRAIHHHCRGRQHTPSPTGYGVGEQRL
ncbi:MAG: CHASE2 domain-containing protein [Gammaproteobacteria bacterium]|nr:CHASE2 domain-containing protein [Gammaproteobacteria bacterium]